jgi:hypothetical protein
LVAYCAQYSQGPYHQSKTLIILSLLHCYSEVVKNFIHVTK